MFRAAAIVAAVCVAAGVFVAAGGARAQAAGVAVCGSGNGHGVGMAQYGAYGRAVAGQDYSQILRAYYRGTQLRTYPDNPGVRVMLSRKATGGAHMVTVATGSTGVLVNLATGGSVALGPAAYRVEYLSDRALYRVTNATTARPVGSFTGPILFRRASGGFLTHNGTVYRGELLAQVSGSGFYLINRLPMEGYIRGVVPKEMPASWHQQALRAQTVAARSYARATAGGPLFDYYADVRDQVYGGASAETTATNNAVNATARVVATYNGAPITAYFHSSSGGYVEDSRYVFTPLPYLTSFRDVDSANRRYERRVNSPWLRWDGKLNTDGSSLGVGTITGVRVLERTPSWRAQRVEVTGTRGTTTISGQYNIRNSLRQTGLTRADGSGYPAGILPSARVNFGAACS